VNDECVNWLEAIGVAGLAMAQSKLFKCSVCLVSGAYCNILSAIDQQWQ